MLQFRGHQPSPTGPVIWPGFLSNQVFTKDPSPSMRLPGRTENPVWIVGLLGLG